MTSKCGLRVDAGVAVRVGELKDESRQRAFGRREQSEPCYTWVTCTAHVARRLCLIQFLISKKWRYNHVKMLTDWKNNWNDATGVSLLFKFKGSNKSKKIASGAPVDSPSPDSLSETRLCLCVLQSHSLDVELVKLRSSVSETMPNLAELLFTTF